MEVDGHVVIDVCEDWKNSLRERLEDVKYRRSTEFRDTGIVIPRVPDTYFESYKKSYGPRKVSIGPYHHGKRQLQAMEEEKMLCFSQLIDRGRTTLDDCIEAMRKLEERARRCYSENILLSSNDFTEMMMFDAAFVIVKFLKLSTEEWDSYRFNFAFEFALIKRDMLLLENQLPFFVLECLFELALSTILPPGDRTDLISLAINFLNYPEQNRQSNRPEQRTVNHLLHLYQLQCYSYSSFSDRRLPSRFPSATNLEAMEVQFRVAPPESVLTDVTFGVDQVMKIPRLLISEDTVALFLNLIAFEQSNLNMGTHFTCYAVFMSHMLNDANDVEFLCEKGIIENSLGSHQEVVDLFRSMSEAVVVDPSSSIAGMFSRVSEFSHNNWRILKAIMKGSPWWSTYFRDPVTLALTLVGGVGLWLFTALQTFYAVYSYYHPS